VLLVLNDLGTKKKKNYLLPTDKIINIK
jgi:hypothetical protein